MFRVLGVALIAITTAACASRIVRAPHSLPASVQLKAASLGRVWVAGFVATQTRDLDVNVETVRLLRARLRAHVPGGTVETEPLAIESEQRLSDVAYWRTLGEEHGTPLIVTASVKLLLAPPEIVQRGPRAIYIPTAGRVLEATVVLIDGKTGVALSTQRLPTRMRYGMGRFSSGLSLFLQLMERAMPDWLAAITSAP